MTEETANSKQSNGTEYVDWFDALGNEVPREQRKAAAEEAQKMGVDATADSPWVNEVADLVKMDQPKEAIETARVHLDLTGTYRFLAALCVPPDDKTNTDIEQTGVEN